jgi:hypothetical protein
MLERNDLFIINTNPDARGFYNDINQTQIKILEEFKEKIKQSSLVSNIHRYNDRFFLRFLRARKFNITNAFTMISDYFQWRKDQQVDMVYSFEFPEIKELKKLYPHGYHNTDKQGRPVYIEAYGGIDVDKIFKATTEERWLRYYIREYEILVNYKFRACSKMKGTVVEQTFNITNLAGISLSMLTGNVKTMMQKLSNIGRNYYPEILGKSFLINAPFIFSMMWGIVKGFLDVKTVEKITVLKDNYAPVLLEHIDKDKLPKILGGECKCEGVEGGCLFSDVGPWKV